MIIKLNARTGPAILYKALTIIHQAYYRRKLNELDSLGTENRRGRG